MKKTVCLVLLIWSVAASAPAAEDAGRIVREAFDYMRGTTSTATMEMVIHRPDFTRTMVIRAGPKEMISGCSTPCPRPETGGTPP